MNPKEEIASLEAEDDKLRSQIGTMILERGSIQAKLDTAMTRIGQLKHKLARRPAPEPRKGKSLQEGKGAANIQAEPLPRMNSISRRSRHEHEPL